MFLPPSKRHLLKNAASRRSLATSRNGHDRHFHTIFLEGLHIDIYNAREEEKKALEFHFLLHTLAFIAHTIQRRDHISVFGLAALIK